MIKWVMFLGLIFAGDCYTVNDFRPALFHSSPPSGIYNVEVGTNLSGQILAMGNLNGDQQQIVSDQAPTTSPSVRQLPPPLKLIYGNYVSYSPLSKLFSQSKFLIKSHFSKSCQCHTSYDSQFILYTVDFDLDTFNNIAFILQKNSQYYVQIYSVSCQFSQCTFKYEDLNYSQFGNMTTAPILIDLRGDGRTAFITFNGQNRSVVTIVQPFKTYFQNDLPSYNVVINSFATLIDLNGDCISDLSFISVNASGTTIQSYIKNNDGKYHMNPTITINKTITWFGGVDIDGNGASDLLYLASSSSTASPTLYFIPNQKQVTEICTAFPQPSFSYVDIQKMLIVSPYSFTSQSVITLGDLNFDGLPQIISIFVDPQSPNKKIASILLNKGNFTLERYSSINIETVEEVVSPQQFVCFDFTQNGKLDLMIMSKGVRHSLINNIIEDSLFIKILPLSLGSGDSSGKLITAYGATVQWHISNLNGDRTIKVVSQRTQWSFNSLPFATLGLGRTNNYIEDLTVGGQTIAQTFSWTPVIPNSQLLVFLGSSTLETILTDNARVYNVVEVSIIILFVLGFVILLLSYREAQQDKRDQYVFLQMIK